MSNSENDHRELEDKIGYHFESPDILRRALTHRSALGGPMHRDYERLEFLGDAVLDLVIADLLLKENRSAKEGELSKMRAAIVNTESLADTARELELSKYVIVSRAELAQQGNKRPSILADVVESLMGAIYRESGYEAARIVIEKLFLTKVKTVQPNDPKTDLQEYLHAKGCSAPEYALEQVEGPEHAPSFISTVTIDGNVKGRGEGKTKKASQQAAAEEALKALAVENFDGEDSEAQNV